MSRPTVSLLIDGNEYSLDNRTYARLVGHDGWGMPPSTRVSSQGPLQHGDTDEGQFLQPRVGILKFLVPSTNLGTMYSTSRSQLLELFHPENSLSVKFTLSDSSVRQIDCVFAEDLTMPWTPEDGANLNVTVMLKCSNPAFYDPTVNTTQWLGFPTGTFFAIPWVVNTFVGGSGIDQDKIIDYAGTWFEYPEVEITGPAVDPIMTNLTNGYKLDFTGVTLGSGEKRIIDTRYGYKTVVDESGNNVISGLTSDSDLTTFRLERKRFYDTYRENVMNFIASGTDGNTVAIIRWKNRYIGV